MGSFLYFISVLFVIGWAVGFLGFHIGGIFHAFLIIALIAVILRMIGARSRVEEQ